MLGPVGLMGRAAAKFRSLFEQVAQIGVQAREQRGAQKLVPCSLDTDLERGGDVGDVSTEQSYRSTSKVVRQPHFTDLDRGALDGRIDGPQKGWRGGGLDDRKGLVSQVLPGSQYGVVKGWVDVAQQDGVLQCTRTLTVLDTGFVGFLGARHAAADQDQEPPRMDGAAAQQSDRCPLHHQVGGQDSTGNAVELQQSQGSVSFLLRHLL